MTYETRVLTIAVMPPGEAIYSERVTEVAVVDEASGEYVEVRQDGPGLGKIAIDPDEWPVLRDAIDRMIGECRATAA